MIFAAMMKFLRIKRHKRMILKVHQEMLNANFAMHAILQLIFMNANVILSLLFNKI